MLTYARRRVIRGETQYNPVSRFIGEIPPELLDSGRTAPNRKMGAWSSDTDSVEMRPSAGKGGNFSGLSGEGFGQGKKNAETDYRPKAIVRPKATVKADKPFIAKGIGSLNQLAGVSKGAARQAPAALSYAEGDRVCHIKYGEGSVLHIGKEERDYKVTVDFDKAGQKIMYASFAKLKRL